jgi:hypothetical protein
MIVNVLPNADPPYAFVEGIESDRALSTLIRAIMNWYAFGGYNHVIVDLTSFDGWSGPVVERFATAVGPRPALVIGSRSSRPAPVGRAAPMRTVCTAARTARMRSGPCSKSDMQP